MSAKITGDPLGPFYQIFDEELSAESIEFLKKLTPPPNKNGDILDMFLKGGYPDPVLS